jgi:hypothetical protein
MKKLTILICLAVFMMFSQNVWSQDKIDNSFFQEILLTNPTVIEGFSNNKIYIKSECLTSKKQGVILDLVTEKFFLPVEQDEHGYYTCKYENGANYWYCSRASCKLTFRTEISNKSIPPCPRCGSMKYVTFQGQM